MAWNARSSGKLEDNSDFYGLIGYLIVNAQTLYMFGNFKDTYRWILQCFAKE